MLIGIDIDGVLTNDDDYILDYAIKYCFENNRNNYINPILYETRKFEWSEDITEDYRNKYFWNYVENEPARRFASEVIERLHREDNQIYIITGRYKSNYETVEGQDMRKNVSKWLEKNNIYYDKLVFCNAEDKARYCVENKIDVMIEDSPYSIPMLAEKTKVFCYDCRYNQEIDMSNVLRVYSWYDIYIKIKEINKI